MSSLSSKDQRYIWHPYTQAKNAGPVIPIVKGLGPYLWDEDGNRYLDAISSWWVNLHGHSNPYLAEKVYEQAKKLEHIIFAGFTHHPAINYAERLLPLLPGEFSKIFYSDNGSTAVEVALKMAIQYWQNLGYKSKTKIIAFCNSYHGDTFGSMSVSERGVFTNSFRDYLFEVVFIDAPTSENADRVTDLVSKISSEVACIIYEPLIQGAGGMLMHDSASLNQLITICKAKNIICIADEVMTGYYRTGKLFAGNYVEKSADMICLSKGITGGMMPLGATCCSEEIFDAFVSDDRSRTFFHGHSYTANPLSLAAANASLDLLLLPECRERIESINTNHKRFLENLESNSSSLGTINHRMLGTILAFDIKTEASPGYLNEIAQNFSRNAFEKGMIIRPLGNTVYLMPPYCITDEDLQLLYNSIIEILQSRSWK